MESKRTPRVLKRYAYPRETNLADVLRVVTTLSYHVHAFQHCAHPHTFLANAILTVLWLVERATLSRQEGLCVSGPPPEFRRNYLR